MSIVGTLGAIVGGGALGLLAAKKSNEKEKALNSAALLDDRTWQEQQAQKAMDFSSAEALRQMDFQREMSNTSYQRAVADLQSAGLNPALAYMQGGASTMPGASGTGYQASTPSTALHATMQSQRLMYGLANTAIKLLGR